jgi:hypothetical protein
MYQAVTVNISASASVTVMEVTDEGPYFLFFLLSSQTQKCILTKSYLSSPHFTLPLPSTLFYSPHALSLSVHCSISTTQSSLIHPPFPSLSIILHIVSSLPTSSINLPLHHHSPLSSSLTHSPTHTHNTNRMLNKMFHKKPIFIL